MSRLVERLRRAWPLRRGPGYRIVTRDDVQYAEDSERMAHIVAGMFCPSCGTSVGDDNLHSADCIDVPNERRRSR